MRTSLHNLDPKKKMFMLAGKTLSGDPTVEAEPGAHRGAHRNSLVTDTSKIVYLDLTAGNDANSGDSPGAAKKTFAAAKALVNATTKLIVETITDDDLYTGDAIGCPIQSSIGKAPKIFSKYPGEVLNVQTGALSLFPINFAGGNGKMVVTQLNGSGVVQKVALFSNNVGLTWTSFTIPFGAAYTMSANVFYDSVEDSFVFIAAKIEGVLLCYTKDFTSYTFRQVTNSYNLQGQLTGDLGFRMIRNGQTIIIVTEGTDDSWIISTDGGLTYSVMRSTTRPSRDIVFFNNVYVSAKNNNSAGLIYSSDGLTWAATSRITGTYIQLCAGGGELFAVGLTQPDNQVSTDGTTFANPTGGIFGFTWTSVAHNGEFFDGITGNSFRAYVNTSAASSLFSTFDLDVASTANTRWLRIASYANFFAITRRDQTGPATFTAGTGMVEFGNYRLSPELSGAPASETIGVLCGFDTKENTVPGIRKLSASKGFGSTGLVNCTLRTLSKPVPNSFIDLAVILYVSNRQCKFIEARSDALSGTMGGLATLIDFRECVIVTPQKPIAATYSVENVILIDNYMEGTTATFTNAGSSGAETLIDNVFKCGIVASNVVINVRGGAFNPTSTSTNVTFDSNVILTPDFLLDSFYRPKRRSGYGGTDQSPIDSLLIAASKFFLNSVGDQRDIGPWSFNTENVVETYTRSMELPKPLADKLQFAIKNRAYANEGMDAEIDVFNDVQKRGQHIEWTFSVGSNVWEFFDWLEQQEDTEVAFSLDRQTTIINQTVTVNGAHSVGDVVLNVDPINLFPGILFIRNGQQYYAVYTLDASNQQTHVQVIKLILSRPLKDAIVDNATIQLKMPYFLGIFKYLPERLKKFRRVFEGSGKAIADVTVVLERKL